MMPPHFQIIKHAGMHAVIKHLQYKLLCHRWSIFIKIRWPINIIQMVLSSLSPMLNVKTLFNSGCQINVHSVLALLIN